ncbi:hypothetical protein YC2023_040638 [Brassica napus]
MVTPLIQRDVFNLYLTTRGNTTCLCEDMEWETMELSAYHCQFEGLFMIWIDTTTNHVISWSGSVWNGQRCNRWIAPTDLLSDKRRWITINDSRTQDHIRPRTKIDKVSESVYHAQELGSIVLHRLLNRRARNVAKTLAGRSHSPSPTPLKLLVRFNLLQLPPVHQRHLDVPRFVDQSIGANQHGDQDVLNNLTDPSRVRPDWSFGWNHVQTTEPTEPQPVFPDQLDTLRPTVEPDLAWVVKKPKTYMHSYPADHPDSPASVLIFTQCIHLVRMNLDNSRRVSMTRT